MSHNERNVPKEAPSPKQLLLSSEQMPNERKVAIETRLRERKVGIKALSRIGESYSGSKKATEDASVILGDHDTLQAIVVDGGTQIGEVPTLHEIGLTGGRYIAEKVEQFGAQLQPSVSIAANLRTLNRRIGEDMEINHPAISHHEYSYNVPYGSIAGIRADAKQNTLEVANAGDVFVVVIDVDGNPQLLIVDDIYDEDHSTFDETRRLANEHNESFRHVMQQRTRDPRFRSVVEELRKTMRNGNVGRVRRINGSSNFDVTSSVIIQLDKVQSVFVFTDGGVSPGFSMSTPEGLHAFTSLVSSIGLEGLDEEVRGKMAADPDYEEYPRFGSLDDLMIIEITV